MKLKVLLFALLAIASCQKPTVEVRVTQQKAPFYFRFEVKDTISEEYQFVNYTLGDSVLIFDHLDTGYHQLTWRNRIDGVNGTYYFRTGLSDMRFGSIIREDLFGFGFAIPGLEPGKIPTRAMVEDFFYPGRSIPFGLGPEKVNALLRLQIGNPAFSFPCQTVFLYEPYGELQIQGVEDYEIQYRTWPEETRKGKRITCSFEGGIGAEWRLLSPIPNTDRAIDLRNGEAAFFIPYE